MVNLMLVQCVIASHNDLSVLVEILSGVDSDHDRGPRRNGSRKKVMLTKDATLSSHLTVYVL